MAGRGAKHASFVRTKMGRDKQKNMPCCTYVFLISTVRSTQTAIADGACTVLGVSMSASQLADAAPPRANWLTRATGSISRTIIHIVGNVRVGFQPPSIVGRGFFYVGVVAIATLTVVQPPIFRRLARVPAAPTDPELQCTFEATRNTDKRGMNRDLGERTSDYKRR